MCTHGIIVFFRTGIRLKEKRQAFQWRGKGPVEANRRTGDDLFDMVKDLKVIFGKGPSRQPVPNDADGHAPMWKKKILFWEREYWKFLEVRSAINVMHLTKNLCVNLLGFFGFYGKTKDTPEAMYERTRRHASRAVSGLRSYKRRKRNLF
jgi:hypothetical protein